MRKRGASHIEVILAVILFIGFVGVALYFFSPANSNRIVDSSLSYVFSEVKKNTTVDLEVYSVKLLIETKPKISITMEEINDIENKKRERVENKDYQLLNSRKDGNTIYIERNGNDFFYIMISEDFRGGVLDRGNPIPPEAYKKGITSSRKVISEKRVERLRDRYDNNENGYTDLKREFNIPGRVEFSFELLFYDGSKIGPEREVEGSEVFSKNENVEVLRNDGTREFAVLRVKVW